jgi:hypothetical protein
MLVAGKSLIPLGGHQQFSRLRAVAEAGRRVTKPTGR